MFYTSMASVTVVSIALIVFIAWLFLSDDEDKWKF